MSVEEEEAAAWKYLSHLRFLHLLTLGRGLQLHQDDGSLAEGCYHVYRGDRITSIIHLRMK